MNALEEKIEQSTVLQTWDTTTRSTPYWTDVAVKPNDVALDDWINNIKGLHQGGGSAWRMIYRLELEIEGKQP